MPINILRLNHAPSSHPNSLIAFIKPLSRPGILQEEYDHASKFLYAIAAQCLPIMKSHHLSVTTLEEHEPNQEFIGRNFNNGEVIQLVLRRKHGGWISFDQAQMVMMHELAHNVQMNHARAFWVERNIFVREMQGLWNKGYTGEGFWGAGRSLESLKNHQGVGLNIGIKGEVKELCGGPFRSRRMKRKRRGDGRGGVSRPPTWKEQRDRRIEKKFGKNGAALGEDEDARFRLELGRKGPLGGRPKVAGSKRGRELRAAAALSRLEAQEQEQSPNSETVDESSTDDDFTRDESGGQEVKRSTFTHGHRTMGYGGVEMVKVCGDDDTDDANVQREMEDFRSVSSLTTQSSPHESIASAKISIPPLSNTQVLLPDASRSSQDRPVPAQLATASPHRPRQPAPPLSKSPSNQSALTCPICTTSNDSHSPTCIVCSHVLDRRKDLRAWKCTSESCIGSEYVNAGDSGRCGGCGAKRGAEEEEEVVTRS